MEMTLQTSARQVRVLPLEEIVEQLKSEALKEKTLLLRRKFGERMPTERVDELSRMPRLLGSGSFTCKKGMLELKDYNGCVGLEITGLADAEEAAALRNRAAECWQTLLAYVGVSGRSVKLWVRFARPDGTLPTEPAEIAQFQEEAYRQAVLNYRMTLGCTLPPRNPELSRAVCLAYDAGCYCNPQAQVVPLLKRASTPALEKEEPVQENALDKLMPGVRRSHLVSTLFEAAFNATIQKEGSWERYTDSDDLKPFLVTLAHNCFLSGIPEEDVVRWSRVYLTLHGFEFEIEATVHNVYALQKPHRFGGRPALNKEQQLVHQLQEFLERRYELRYNVAKMEVEYLERRSFYFRFRPLDKRAANGMCLRAHAEGLSIWDMDVNRYVNSDLIPAFSPFEDYIDKLPKWDGADYIRALARRVPCDNPLWEGLFYKWFLSMVYHWLHPEAEFANSVSPLLTGRQGCGKSSFCRKLLPLELQEYYTDSIDFSERRKTELSLTRFALINIDEFDGISPNHQALLKHILQKPVVNVAPPNRGTVCRLPRFASFIATSNNTDLLTDPTGSRRFLCVECTGEIDHQTSIPYKQLYAQAVEALQNGEQYWMTKEEEVAVTQQNSYFNHQELEEQLFYEYFRVAKVGEEAQEWQAVGILNYLSARSKISLSEKRANHFGRFLRSRNLPFKRTGKGAAYLLVAK